MFERCRLATSLAGMAILLLPAPLVALDRYVAWLDDGTRLTSKSLADWPLPAGPSHFGGREITAENPLRLVRDRQAATVLRPPYLVMASGDLICGRPTQLEPSFGRQQEMRKVRVQLEPPILPV